MSNALETTKISSISELISKNVPALQVASGKAVAAMQEIQKINTEEEYADAEDLLSAVKVSYDKMYKIRTEITGPIDELKKYLMAFERPLSDDKSSEFTRVRNEMVAFRQRELDKKKKIEEEAAKKREKENHIVDIKTAVLKRLTEMVIQKTKDAFTKSEAYFESCTVDDFDKKAEVFMKMKPNLKVEDYDKCFSFQFNQSILSQDEYNNVIIELKKVEPYDKWSEEVIKEATPIINTWRSQIPQLKEDKIALEKAKADKEQHEKVLLEQKRKQQAEQARHDQEMKRREEQKQLAIEADASVDKMNNSFVEQATVQQAGDTGPVKYILKFEKPETTLKALTSIIYHCMANPEFPGIQKKDKKGALVVDTQGQPEYIDAVQWWISWFLTNCDGAIDGTKLFEVSKITIRK